MKNQIKIVAFAALTSLVLLATAQADETAPLWTCNIGYGRKELAQAAYDQMVELPFYNTFFKTTHPPVVALSRKLAATASSLDSLIRPTARSMRAGSRAMLACARKIAASSV